MIGTYERTATYRHVRITGGSIAELKKALKNFPSDVDNYEPRWYVDGEAIVLEYALTETLIGMSNHG